MKESRFTLQECPLCPALVLTGWAGGVLVHLDTLTVPKKDAAVLHRYGFPTLLLRQRKSGELWADWHDPASDKPGPGKWLMAQHRCGARRRQRRMGAAA